MLYLLLAIACSALVSVLMRISTDKVTGNAGMLAVNYLMCLLLAVAYTGGGETAAGTPGVANAVFMGIINGVLYLMGFVLLQLNVTKNGVVLSTTFMKLGLLVPMVVSVCFFREVPALWQVVGFVLAVAAILLVNAGTEKSTAGMKVGLILLLLANGGADAMSKVFEELGDPRWSEYFLLVTFATALLLCICLTFVKRERPGKREILFGLLIGIPNYFSARFLLRSLEHVAAVIVYPTYSVATILVVTVAGLCLFKERLSRCQWIAVAAILVALILLNI